MYFNYTIEFEENGVWTREDKWVRPFYDCDTLDESLDSGKITLFNVTRSEPYKPFTPVRIGIYEVPNSTDDVCKMSESEREQYRVDTVYRLVSEPSVVQKIFSHGGGENRYSHSISTIEYTKKLERVICDSLTFTKYLGKDYIAGALPVEPEHKGLTMDADYYINIMSPYALNRKFVLLSIKESIIPKNGFNHYDAWSALGDDDNNLSYIEITTPSGAKYKFVFTERVELSLSEEGKYYVLYKLHYVTGTEHTAVECSLKYEFLVQKIIEKKEDYSISDTIMRILEVSSTRREGIDKQQYFLNAEIAEKYSRIEAPEFHITRSTLWEALSQIGGYIHAIPRLIYPNIITFDELGGNEEYIAPKYICRLARDDSYNVDEACASIDSTVENFLSTEDLSQGAVVEPCIDGWKSARCDENIAILSNDNALILTEYPIYRIVKVEIAAKEGNSWKYMGNITPYIYEDAEYKTLTAFGGTYPYSKTFALQYTQGDNKIKGFTFKQEQIGEFCSAFEDVVIKKLIERLGGTCPKWFYDLGFRVTYVPMTNARVKQYKPFFEKGKIEANTLLYNQSANTVESSSYGENLKGTTARLGNVDEKETYYFKKYADLPKTGMLWSDRYIARVEREYQKEWIKATVTLTRNFNRLAQYLGIHTNYRLYDVSEKQSVERQINYSEFVKIGNPSEKYTEDSGITDAGELLFQKTFTGHDGVGSVNNALVFTANKNKDRRRAFLIACVSIGLGNSLSFSWKFVDNYGAGYKSSESDKLKRVQEIAPYGDDYGEFWFLELSLYTKYPSRTLDSEAPHRLPEFYEEQYVSPIFQYRRNPFVIRKDSREQINMTTQLHFVANRRSVVIGSGMSQYNALVSPDPLETELIFSEKRLNVLRPIFSEDESGTKDFTVQSTNGGFVISITNVPSNAKSWALIGTRRNANGSIKSRQLIIGENIDGDVQPVYFTFVSNKEENLS